MTTPLPPNPFMIERQFEPDLEKLADAIDPPPLFLGDPSPEFMTAVEILPLLEVLSKY